MEYLDSLEEKLIKSYEKYLYNLNSIHSIGAHPSILKNIKIDYYGSYVFLNEVASIKKVDSNNLTLNPYDKSILKELAKAIINSNLQVNVSDDGIIVRVFVPSLTEETRKKFVKQVKDISEEAKIANRNIRHEINKKISNDKDINEDEKKKYLKDIQKIIDDYNEKINNELKIKTSELMKI